MLYSNIETFILKKKSTYLQIISSCIQQGLQYPSDSAFDSDSEIESKHCMKTGIVLLVFLYVCYLFLFMVENTLLTWNDIKNNK